MSIFFKKNTTYLGSSLSPEMRFPIGRRSSCRASRIDHSLLRVPPSLSFDRNFCQKNLTHSRRYFPELGLGSIELLVAGSGRVIVVALLNDLLLDDGLHFGLAFVAVLARLGPPPTAFGVAVHEWRRWK